MIPVNVTQSCLSGLVWLLLAVGCAAEPVSASDQHDDRMIWLDRYRSIPALVRDTRVAPQWLPHEDRLVAWSEVGTNAGTFELVDAGTGQRLAVLGADALALRLAALTERAVEHPSNPPFLVSEDGHAVLFRHADRTFRLVLGSGEVGVADPDALATRAFEEGGHLTTGTDRMAVADEQGVAVYDRTGRLWSSPAAKAGVTWRLSERPWSPDGRHLAVWRDDAADVQSIPIVDYARAQEQVSWAPYARTGAAISQSTLHLLDVGTGDLAPAWASPEAGYAWLAGWQSDAREALVLSMSRDGKTLKLISVDTRTRHATVLIEESRPETFVAGLDFAIGGWTDQLVVLGDGSGYLWASERSGWRNFYRYDRSGDLENSPAPASYPIHRIAGVVADDRVAIAIASPDPEHPYDRIPIAIDLGSGAIGRLAETGGVHSVVSSPTGAHYIDDYSSRTTPRVREIATLQGPIRTRLSEADVSGLADLGWTPPEPFTSTAADGSTALHGVLYKPHDFDPSKRYAVIDYIYGGPFTTITPSTFMGTGETVEAYALAQLGFIVLVMDGRGTPGRSKDFQDASYGRIGDIEIADHVAGLRQVGADRPWMDLERVGIVGHSWGGYFALRGMLTAPDVYKAGYAGAPGDLEQDALVNEPYMGSPIINADAYLRGSNLPLAGQLRGALKLMHGAADTSAPMSTTMRMSQALIEVGKPFELLIMPAEGHTPDGQDADYYAHDIGRFFLNHLGEPE